MEPYEKIMEEYSGQSICRDAAKENAKLREQLAEAINAQNELHEQIYQLKQRAEAAEAKLKAASEQEPVSEWLKTEISAIDCRYRGDPSYDHDAYWMRERVMTFIDRNKHIIDCAPIPPADVQELQRELAAMQTLYDEQVRMRAELEHKLEGLHEELDACGAQLYDSISKGECRHHVAQAREEGRKEAVPEGIVSVEASFDYEPGGIITPYLKVMFAKGTDSNELWKLRDKAKAMLAAAPKPEVKP